MQAAESAAYPRIEVPLALSDGKYDGLIDVAAMTSFEVRFHSPEEEIA
jgi:NAD+ synthase (glutamine-hydrolysing)